MSDSLQKWVGRNRPPRVQITYDVEIGDAIEKKELPLVVGLMAWWQTRQQQRSEGVREAMPKALSTLM